MKDFRGLPPGFQSALGDQIAFGWRRDCVQETSEVYCGPKIVAPGGRFPRFLTESGIHSIIYAV